MLFSVSYNFVSLIFHTIHNLHEAKRFCLLFPNRESRDLCCCPPNAPTPRRETPLPDPPLTILQHYTSEGKTLVCFSRRTHSARPRTGRPSRNRFRWLIRALAVCFSNSNSNFVFGDRFRVFWHPTADVAASTCRRTCLRSNERRAPICPHNASSYR